MKRFIVGLMVFALLLMPLNSFALTDNEAYAGNQLRTLGILKGYPDGTLGLANNITRCEVATLTMRILGYEAVEVLGQGKTFTDLPSTHWAYQYIQNAYKLSVIHGYPSGEFKPNNNIAYAEVVAIMVNALGEQTDIVGAWPNNYLDKAKALGIIPKDSVVDPTRIVTRGEMSVIVWDTLLIKE
ncbi:MAG: S-layer homology domain-containing protein [Vallitaleaceae bacterium]|jgi:hypothetical protein|nr:S-layer homology domain-containing protein [Vallitaleaceae bacterium]